MYTCVQGYAFRPDRQQRKMHKAGWIFGKVRVIATKANFLECIYTEYMYICIDNSLSGGMQAYHAVLVSMYTMIQTCSRAHCRHVYMYTRIQGRAYPPTGCSMFNIGGGVTLLNIRKTKKASFGRRTPTSVGGSATVRCRQQRCVAGGKTLKAQ